ncbi:MAG: metallophosphoesterase [Firmicutes bacterium]|nr:metallophosphoesterase [Bacillota bacterium]
MDRTQLVQAKEWLDALDVPYLAIPGNHDLGAYPWRGQQYPDSEHYHPGPWESTHFASVFCQPPLVTAVLGPMRVIGLALREGDPDGVLDALDRELDWSSMPTILFSHYPLAPVRAEGVLSSFGSEDYIPQSARRLLELVQAHPEIVLYAAGHVHAVSVSPLPRRPLQLTAGGLGPGPSQWWLYHVTDTELLYESRLGAGPLTFWDRFLQDDSISLQYHWEFHAGQRGLLAYRESLT